MLRTCLAGLALGGALAAAAPTLDNPDPHALTNTAGARAIIAAARARRVDFAIIGDSNVRVGAAASGHENAMARALSARLGMYASRVEPVSAYLQWGGEWTSSVSYTADPFVRTGAPPETAALFFTDDALPQTYARLPTGTPAAPSYNAGSALLASHPLGITQALRYHLTHWRHGAGGYLTLCVRNLPTSSPVYGGPIVVPTSGPGVLEDVALDVPAGARLGTGIFACVVDWPDNLGALGPALLTYNRFENTSRTSGIAYSPYWIHGGYSAWNVCNSFRNDPHGATATAEWFRQATRLQAGPPMLVVHILHGGNDINDTRPSLGAISGLPSNSPAGHEDNVRFIISTLRAWWTQAGYDGANLYFLLGPYHPRPGETNVQAGFESAWESIAAGDAQVVAIAGTRLSTPEEIVARNWRLTPDDPFHLNAPGFAAWAGATARVLMLNHCPADFNESGNASVQDLFDFLAAWFAHAPTAEVNQSGSATVQDLFDFLRLYFAGCA